MRDDVNDVDKDCSGDVQYDDCDSYNKVENNQTKLRFRLFFVFSVNQTFRTRLSQMLSTHSVDLS